MFIVCNGEVPRMGLLVPFACTLTAWTRSNKLILNLSGCRLKKQSFQAVLPRAVLRLYSKAHSHSKSGGSIWASLQCQCCFWIAGEWIVTEYKLRHSREAQIEPPLFECEWAFRMLDLNQLVLGVYWMASKNETFPWRSWFWFSKY
jgi:hypothetical protein